MRIILILALLGTASAAPVTYTVQTQLDNLNVLTVESETDLENFTGRSNQVSGSVQFDPSAKTGSATLMVDGKSINTGVATRDEHMRGKDWLNFEAMPEIKFQTTSVRWLKDNTYEVKGSLTMNGVTKPVSTTATVKLTPANEVTKKMKLAGDALAVTTKFNVNLTDFRVNHPAIAAGRVNNTLPITLKFIASNQ